MLFYFIISITYRQKFDVYLTKNQYQMQSFGFDANGSYFIDVEDIPARLQAGIQIAFLNKKQYTKRFFKIFPPSLCDQHDITKYFLNSFQHTLEGTFSQKIVLYPFLLQCDPPSERLNLKITTQYRNPTTFLDNRMVNGIYGEVTISILYFLLSAFWIINIVKNSKSKNELHYLITAIILSFTFTHILRFFELSQLHKSDEAKGITNFRIVLSFLTSTLCAIFILLGSEGYCILVDSVPRQRIITSTIVSALLMGSLYFTYYFTFSESSFKMIFLDLIIFIFYGYELYKALGRADAHVSALLLTAQNSEPGEVNSSIFKNKQYKRFRMIFVGILIVLIVLLILSNIAFFLPNWVNSLFVSLIEFSVVCVTALIFRPRGEKGANGLLERLIGDDDNPNNLESNRIEIDSTADTDEIPLMSLDGPTPNQPLLAQEVSTKKDKKLNGNKYSFL